MLGRRITCADCGTEFVAQADPFSMPGLSGQDDPRARRGVSSRRRPAGNPAGKVVLILGAVLVLGVAGYFVYQHFIVDRHPALKAAEMEALNYLPASSDLVVGIDVNNSLAKPEFAEVFKKHLAQNNALNLTEVLQEFLGLRIEDLDHVAFSRSDGHLPGGIPPHRKRAVNKHQARTETLVLKTKAAYDRGRVLKKIKAGPAQTLQGKEYFRLPDNDDFSILYMPSETIIVLAKVPDNRLGTILSLEGSKPSLSEDTLTMLRQIGKAHAWAVMMLGPQHKGLPAGIPNDFLFARGFGCWVKSQGEQVDVAVGMICHDGPTAKRLAGELEKAKTGIRQKVDFLIRGSHKNVADEALNNLHFSHGENVVWGSTRVRIANLRSLPVIPLPAAAQHRRDGKQKKPARKP
jgi:hypothetical protein